MHTSCALSALIMSTLAFLKLLSPLIWAWIFSTSSSSSLIFFKVFVWTWFLRSSVWQLIDWLTVLSTISTKWNGSEVVHAALLCACSIHAWHALLIVMRMLYSEPLLLLHLPSIMALSFQLVSSNTRLNCSLCDKSYADRKGLLRPLHDSHPEKGDDTGSLLCPICFLAKWACNIIINVWIFLLNFSLIFCDRISSNLMLNIDTFHNPLRCTNSISMLFA